MKLKPEFVERLEALPEHGFWNLAFSMDESESITFHIIPRTLIGQNISAKGIDIPLDSYNRMFDLTEVEEVTTQ
jgi:hypothetical protein